MLANSRLCAALVVALVIELCRLNVNCHAAEPQLVVPQPVEDFRNPWPAAWEEQFQQRGEQAIQIVGEQKLSIGNTYGENEKDTYPRAMFHFLAGDRENALKALQASDAQSKTDHAHTQGIDFYWSFTLKGQVRKYFLFGDLLDPDYKQRMLAGAKTWTEQDPLRRPHPIYGKGKNPGREAWGPDAKGSWVDVRNTDNLRAMRDTSIYLFAEEAGNEAARQQYKERIKQYVQTLFNIGMSEWDSENYHSHALSSYHNLYDFAKDPEVKLLAKAGLDWLYAAGAVKYYRGGFGGPVLRDYGGGNVAFGANTSHPLAIYFGDAPQADPTPDRDDVYIVTSSYRPPQAVVHLARKQFTRPVELMATKPPYQDWRPGLPTEPKFWETQYFGQTYQFGSLVSSAPETTWNAAPLKLMAWNSRRGVDYFVANTSPLGEHSAKNAGDQIGQYRNALIWLRPATPAATFYFQVPISAKEVKEEGVWFFEFEKTYLALRPIRLSESEECAAAGKHGERYADDRFFKATTTGSSFAGFALEVGEQGTRHRDFASFQQAVRDLHILDLSGLASGVVALDTTEGRRLQVKCNAQGALPTDLPNVERDGVLRDWAAERDVYLPIGANTPFRQKMPKLAAPIYQAWQTGTLRVEAGGKIFQETVDADGRVEFSEQ